MLVIFERIKNIIIIEGLATDVTARKNAEIALKEKNIKLEKMLLEIKTLRGLSQKFPPYHWFLSFCLTAFRTRVG